MQSLGARRPVAEEAGENSACLVSNLGVVALRGLD